MDKGEPKRDNSLAAAAVQPKCPRCLPGPLPGKKGIGMTLKKENWTVPAKLEFADDVLIPLRAGENLAWKLVD